MEAAGPNPPPDAPELVAQLAEVEKKVAMTLADRLQARALPATPGYLVLNPCSFTRRVALEVDGGPVPVPVGRPIKASQLDGNMLRLVVEVPGLGFAWVPREGPSGTAPPAVRMRLADQRGVRNEFFEAEIDQVTGGLRAICDRPFGQYANKLSITDGGPDKHLGRYSTVGVRWYFGGYGRRSGSW